MHFRNDYKKNKKNKEKYVDMIQEHEILKKSQLDSSGTSASIMLCVHCAILYLWFISFFRHELIECGHQHMVHTKLYALPECNCIYSVIEALKIDEFSMR